MFFNWIFFGIGIAESLKSTNINIIPAFGIVFQYNTIHIVHLWFQHPLVLNRNYVKCVISHPLCDRYITMRQKKVL